MSISATLSSALSGLTAAARGAEVVSSNISNALTDGYGRRSLDLASRTVGASGAGVRVAGISREADPILLSDRRVAEAGHADASVRQQFLLQLEQSLGTPDETASLGGRIARFESALIEAASRPDSEARLAGVFQSAGALSTKLNAISSDIQAARGDADSQIATDVETLNSSLARIAEMNAQIRTHMGGGRDASALMDQRQQLIDRVAEIIPIREVPRDGGQVALYTTGGAALVEGRAAVFGFTPVNLVTPDMTIGSGALSGLTINGNPVRTEGPTSPIAGGSMAANFAVRDELAPAAQVQIDAIARDLVERFADPSVDPTLAPGDPGLFTDAGFAFVSTDEVGLAGRLSLNFLVDPAQGGALWRLRDGLGAAAQGPVGNADGLNRLYDALQTLRPPASGGFTGGGRNFGTLAGDILSMAGAGRQAADAEASFAAARSNALRGIELQQGVDTDQEMQHLLLIEQAYAANAKVVKTVDEMIQLLLGF